MKVINNDSSIHIIRLDKDDELIKCVTDYATTHSLMAGSINAIGSAKKITLSFFNFEKHEFEDHYLSENLEIVSLNGNLAMLDEKLTIHIHGTFSKNNLSVIGGHVKELVISATCEVLLIPLEVKLLRAKDDMTGLNLLQ